MRQLNYNGLPYLWIYHGDAIWFEMEDYTIHLVGAIIQSCLLRTYLIVDLHLFDIYAKHDDNSLGNHVTFLVSGYTHYSSGIHKWSSVREARAFSQILIIKKIKCIHQSFIII